METVREIRHVLVAATPAGRLKRKVYPTSEKKKSCSNDWRPSSRREGKWEGEVLRIDRKREKTTEKGARWLCMSVRRPAERTTQQILLEIPALQVVRPRARRTHFPPPTTTYTPNKLTSFASVFNPKWLSWFHPVAHAQHLFFQYRVLLLFLVLLFFG